MRDVFLSKDTGLDLLVPSFCIQLCSGRLSRSAACPEWESSHNGPQKFIYIFKCCISIQKHSPHCLKHQLCQSVKAVLQAYFGARVLKCVPRHLYVIFLCTCTAAYAALLCLPWGLRTQEFDCMPFYKLPSTDPHWQSIQGCCFPRTPSVCLRGFACGVPQMLPRAKSNLANMNTRGMIKQMETFNKYCIWNG